MWQNVAGASFLNREAGTFLFDVFKVSYFYIWKLFYSLQVCVIHLKKNIFFSVTITLRKKSYSKLSKQEPAYVCKEGWCVGLWQEGACLQEGGVTEGTI